MSFLKRIFRFLFRRKEPEKAPPMKGIKILVGEQPEGDERE